MSYEEVLNHREMTTYEEIKLQKSCDIGVSLHENQYYILRIFTTMLRIAVPSVLEPGKHLVVSPIIGIA